MDIWHTGGVFPGYLCKICIYFFFSVTSYGVTCIVCAVRRASEVHALALFKLDLVYDLGYTHWN